VDRERLQKSDGKDGRETLIGFEGKVYDVSESRLWKNGLHMNLHHAGRDLTDHLPMAPHGPEMLERIRQVEALEPPPAQQRDERDELKETLTALYQKFHPHPITIHFPIALFIFSAFLDLLFVIFGQADSLASASLYAFLFAAFVAPMAMGSGFLSWWLNYNATLTSTFLKKIMGSLTLLAVAMVCLAWRLFDPGVAMDPGAAGWIYHGLVISTWPIVAFIGYQGGKITFPS